MKRKILIVDDDVDILEPLSILLQDEGYIIETTPKGDTVYTLMKKFKPDLIILDLLLSGSDGRKICRRLKENDKTSVIPIIMMSAHPGAKPDAIACGANEFIAKPFESANLLNLIKKTFH